MLLSVRNLNFEPAKKATKRGECTDKMFAGPAKSIAAAAGSSPHAPSSLLSVSQAVRGTASSCCSVENRGKTQPNNGIKNMKSIHYTLQVPGGYTRTHTGTHTHWRTHMETITKRRLKPFWKGADNRTKQKPNVQNKTKRQKPLSLSVPVSVRP